MYRVPERIVFISGLVVMILGMIIWMPLGHDKPVVQMTGVRIHNYIIYGIV